MLKRDRKYYRIGEVSRIVGVEPHVLRFWEREFPQVRPRRISGQRLYRQQDIKTIEQIKKLLYHEGYTIAGAKKRLSQRRGCFEGQHISCTGHVNKDDILEEIRRELLEIKRILLQ